MEFNQELNNKLWEKIENKGENSYSLKPDVSKKLKEIADFFIDTNDIPKEAVKDIRIVGSSCNYNYNKYSDLDLHIVVDFDKIHKDCPIVTDYTWAIKQIFNQEHDISIYGIDVEIYVEPIEQEANSNGVYSLTQNKWLKVPEKIKPTKNDSAVQAKFNEIKEAIDKIEDSEYADKLLDKIYSMRKAGLESGGEFSTENLAFKLLRNGGYIDKLRTMKKKKIDKNLTLENLTLAEDDITDKIKKAIDAIYKKTNYTAYITYDAKRDGDYFYSVIADIVSNQDMNIAKELIDDFINKYELKNDGLKTVYNRIKFSLDSKYGKDFVKEHSSELQRMISEQINIVPDYNSFLNQNIPVDIIVDIKNDKDYKIYDKDSTTVIGVGKSVKFLLNSQGYSESDFIEYCNSTEDYDTNTFLGSLAYNQANNIYDYEEIKPFFLGSIWLPDLLNNSVVQINTDCTYGIANKYLSGGYCVGNVLKKPINLNSSDIDIELTNYRLTGVFDIDKHAWDGDITIEKSKNEKYKQVTNIKKLLWERDRKDYLTTNNGESVLRKFSKLHANLIEPLPNPYDGDRDLEAILYYLGSSDGLVARVKTPIETIIFNNRNLIHLLNDNESQRLKDLPKIKATLENPNLIIKTFENGSNKNNYIKAFGNENLMKAQLVIVKVAEDGAFYVTTFRLKNRKFLDKLKIGQIIYDLSDTYANKEKTLSYNNTITKKDEDFKSNIIKSKNEYYNKGVNKMKKRMNEDVMGYWDLVESVKDYIKEGKTVDDAIYSAVDDLVYDADIINIWSDIPGGNSEITDLMREDIEQELYGESELQDYASSLEDDEDTSEALKLNNKSRKNKSLISEKRKSSKKYSILEEAHKVLTMNETSEGGDLTTWQFSAKGFSKAGLEKQSTFGSANLRCIIHENSNGNLVGTVTTDYGMTEEQIRENLIEALRDNGFRTTSITDLTLLY